MVCDLQWNGNPNHMGRDTDRNEHYTTDFGIAKSMLYTNQPDNRDILAIQSEQQGGI